MTGTKPAKFDRTIDPRVDYVYRHYVRTIGESVEYKARRVIHIDGYGNGRTVLFSERTKRGTVNKCIGIVAFRRWAQDSEVLKYEHA